MIHVLHLNDIGKGQLQIWGAGRCYAFRCYIYAPPPPPPLEKGGAYQLGIIYNIGDNLKIGKFFS